jgi:hypothetical protein
MMEDQKALSGFCNWNLALITNYPSFGSWAIEKIANASESS